MSRMLAVDPFLRITAKSALTHPFLAGGNVRDWEPTTDAERMARKVRRGRARGQERSELEEYALAPAVNAGERGV